MCDIMHKMTQLIIIVMNVLFTFFENPLMRKKKFVSHGRIFSLYLKNNTRNIAYFALMMLTNFHCVFIYTY
jgi:hypothetical protein